MKTTSIVSFLFLVATAGCQPRKAPEKPTETSDFECKERRAAYIATGGFAGKEAGVLLDCQEHGPRIESWRALDGGGKKTSEHSIEPREFDDLWSEIEATGWRNLGDCDKTEAGEGEATYKIGVKDETHSSSLTCAGKELPFPYNRLIDSLDLLAGKYSE